MNQDFCSNCFYAQNSLDSTNCMMRACNSCGMNQNYKPGVVQHNADNVPGSGVMNVPTAGADNTDPLQYESNINYMQGYLNTRIGAKVKIDFLLGTSLFVDREGTLEEVGISYVVIRDSETGNLLMGDIYSIKFVRFYH